MEFMMGLVSLTVVHCAPRTTAHDDPARVLLLLRELLLEVTGELMVRYKRLS